MKLDLLFNPVRQYIIEITLKRIAEDDYKFIFDDKKLIVQLQFNNTEIGVYHNIHLYSSGHFSVKYMIVNNMEIEFPIDRNLIPSQLSDDFLIFQSKYVISTSIR